MHDETYTPWESAEFLGDAEVRLTDEHPAAELDHIGRGITRQSIRPVPQKR